MEIEIFPKRLLSASRVEKILNSIISLGMAKNIILHGPKLPKYVVVPSREHLTGIRVETGHEDLKRIRFGDKEVELTVKVGRIIIQPIEGIDLNVFSEKLREICNELLPFGFDIRMGQFTKTRPTISDSIREYIKQ